LPTGGWGSTVRGRPQEERGVYDKENQSRDLERILLSDTRGSPKNGKKMRREGGGGGNRKQTSSIQEKEGGSHSSWLAFSTRRRRNKGNLRDGGLLSGDCRTLIGGREAGIISSALGEKGGTSLDPPGLRVYPEQKRCRPL